MANHQRFIEIDGQQITVTEEAYRAYKRPLLAEHKRKEREKRCRDDNGNRCTGDCSNCNKQRAGSALSLDRFIPVKGKRVPVSEEVYQEYYRPIWRVHDHARRHGQCGCTDWKRCEGDCGLCRYRDAGDTLSLDYTYANESGEEFSMMDMLEDETVRIEEITTDRAVLEQLFNRLDEIMPEARRIVEFRLAGLTDTEIAKVLGVARTTFLSRIKKAAELLKGEYSDMF